MLELPELGRGSAVGAVPQGRLIDVDAVAWPSPASNVSLLPTCLRADPQTSSVEVVVVDNGTDVFERLRAESFDLLISDVNMPGMSIVHVLRQIEDDPKLANLPVVIMSSVGLDEPIVRTGPLAFVRKPDMKVSLIQAIGKVMAGVTELSDAPQVVRATVPSVLDAATVRIFTDFASQNIRVLVVDDSATTRKVTTRLLKIMRVDVDSAADGEEAIRKLEASRFHHRTDGRRYAGHRWSGSYEDPARG